MKLIVYCLWYGNPGIHAPKGIISIPFTPTSLTEIILKNWQDNPMHYNLLSICHLLHITRSNGVYKPPEGMFQGKPTRDHMLMNWQHIELQQQKHITQNAFLLDLNNLVSKTVAFTILWFFSSSVDIPSAISFLIKAGFDFCFILSCNIPIFQTKYIVIYMHFKGNQIAHSSQKSKDQRNN